MSQAFDGGGIEASGSSECGINYNRIGSREYREVSVFQENRALLSRPDLVALPDKPSGAWKNNLLSSKELGCNDQLRSSSLLQCYLHSYVTLRLVGIRG